MPSSKPKQPSGTGTPKAPTRDRSSKKKKKGLGFFAWFVIIALLLICVVGGAALGWASAVLKDLPELTAERLRNPPQASTLYDRKGVELGKLSTDQNFRTLVKPDEIPKHVRDAIVASEDHTFYQHPGIDFMGIARMVLFGGGQGGGSTITQQLARNVYLTLDATWERKLREIVLALRLEQMYSKDEILYFYMNQVFFGHWANGIQAATSLYLGKDVKDISLAEAAMIAALLPSPNEYSPYEDFDLAKKMQGITLDAMVEYGMITAAEATAAKAEEIHLVGLKQVEMMNFSSSYCTDFAIKNFPVLLADVFGSEALAVDALYNGGLKIILTFDADIQAETEASIARKIQEEIDRGYTVWAEKNEDGLYSRQAAAVVVEAKTGEIIAMVGGREYPQDASFVWNRAVDTLRQPGSAIKPLLDYAPALQAKVITIGTVFDDVPTAWGTWKPTNYDNAYFGLINIREALARSQNIPAIKTLQALGPERGVAFLKKLGFTTVDDDIYLPAAIGGFSLGVSVLDMAQAYAAIMNNGVYIHPVYIKEVRNSDDKVIYTSAEKIRRTEVLDVQTNYLVLDLLKTVVSLPYGTGRLGNLGQQTAAKSGTTDDFKDLWFAGGTPEYASAIWIGHDDNAQMHDLYASGVAPKIWKEYMSYIIKDVPVTLWQRPEGLTQATICTVSGKQPSSICPSAKLAQELYLPGTEPAVTDTCTVHVEAKVDITNNLLATPNTPAALTENRVFIRRPVPLSYPLPYGYAPADAGYELPTQYSPNTGQSNTAATQGGATTPTTPGGTPTTPGGTPNTPASVPSSSLPSSSPSLPSSSTPAPTTGSPTGSGSGQTTGSPTGTPTGSPTSPTTTGTPTSPDTTVTTPDDSEEEEIIVVSSDDMQPGWATNPGTGTTPNSPLSTSDTAYTPPGGR